MAPSRAEVQSLDFKAVYHFEPKYKYPADVADQVGYARQTYNSNGDKTFFELLLLSIRVNGGERLYPPRTNNNLGELYQSIVESQAQTHIKQALIFYLLKDVKNQTYKNVAYQFASDVYLSSKFTTLIEGLWSMDRMRFTEAMDYLTQPAIPQMFTEQILKVLIQNNQDHLAIAYYQSVSPPLVNPGLVVSYFELLCRGSTTDAFYFSRTAPETQRRQLLETLIHESLEHKKQERAARGIELIELPFDEDEQAWFEEYLTVGEGRNKHNAADIVMMRNISTGRLREADEDMKELPVSKRIYNEVTWSNVMAGVERGLGPRNADDIYDAD